MTLREMVFWVALSTGEDPVTPNGRSVALGACPALMWVVANRHCMRAVTPRAARIAIMARRRPAGLAARAPAGGLEAGGLATARSVPVRASSIPPRAPAAAAARAGRIQPR